MKFVQDEFKAGVLDDAAKWEKDNSLGCLERKTGPVEAWGNRNANALVRPQFSLSALAISRRDRLASGVNRPWRRWGMIVLFCKSGPQ